MPPMPLRMLFPTKRTRIFPCAAKEQGCRRGTAPLRITKEVLVQQPNNLSYMHTRTCTCTCTCTCACTCTAPVDNWANGRQLGEWCVGKKKGGDTTTRTELRLRDLGKIWVSGFGPSLAAFLRKSLLRHKPTVPEGTGTHHVVAVEYNRQKQNKDFSWRTLVYLAKL